MAMSIKTFDKLLEAAQAKGPKRIAIAAAHQSEVMLAGLDAELAGLAEVILVGDKGAIEQIAAEEGFDISRMEVIHQPQPQEAAWQVMKLVSDGKAEIAMKGKVETSDFLRAALNKELGLRTGRLFTHVAVFRDSRIRPADLYQRRRRGGRSRPGAEGPDRTERDFCSACPGSCPAACGGPGCDRGSQPQDPDDPRRSQPVENGRPRPDQGRPGGRPTGSGQCHLTRISPDQGHQE